MAKEKCTYNDFLENSGEQHVEFYNDINSMLTENGFTTKVESKKTGYTLSYLYKPTKKTIINFVNRKKGTHIRIYGNHTDKYMDIFDRVPASMLKELKKASDCKRLIDPNACNSKCQMGVNILIDGELHGKCRYSAMFFLIEPEKYNMIKELVKSEMQERING